MLDVKAVLDSANPRYRFMTRDAGQPYFELHERKPHYNRDAQIWTSHGATVDLDHLNIKNEDHLHLHEGHERPDPVEELFDHVVGPASNEMLEAARKHYKVLKENQGC